jgi:hypothetical protein
MLARISVDGDSGSFTNVPCLLRVEAMPSTVGPLLAGSSFSGAVLAEA